MGFEVGEKVSGHVRLQPREVPPGINPEARDPGVFVGITSAVVPDEGDPFGQIFHARAHGNVFPLRINIPKGFAGLTQASAILIDQILAWDNSLFRQEIGMLPEYLIEEVKAALKDFLDLWNFYTVHGHKVKF